MPPPHRPPARPNRETVARSPAHQRDKAIAEAATAFALLCDAATEALEYLVEELKEEREK